MTFDFFKDAFWGILVSIIVILIIEEWRKRRRADIEKPYVNGVFQGRTVEFITNGGIKLPTLKINGEVVDIHPTHYPDSKSTITCRGCGIGPFSSTKLFTEPCAAVTFEEESD